MFQIYIIFVIKDNDFLKLTRPPINHNLGKCTYSRGYYGT